MLSRRLSLAAAAVLAVTLGACSDDPTTPGQRSADAAQSQAARAGGKTIPDRYIVVFKPGVADAPGLARRLAAGHGGTLRHTYEHAIRGFSVTLPARAAEALRSNPNVAYVEADQVVSVAQASSWGLDRIDQRDRPLNGSYTYTHTGSGVVVYVIDTGIETSHPDFGGRAWGEFDVYGAGGQDCNGHGTHVAGTVGGSTYGVAKSAWLAAVRVLDCGGFGSVSDIIAGVDHVTYNHYTPAVANMSLRVGATQALDDAVRGMVASGVTAVVAAGNESSNACNYSPSRVAEAVTVGASNINDQQAWFSNSGNCLDLYAPGEGITSTWLSGGTNVLDGTSMASPHVAGAAALYLEANPGATPAAVAGHLVSNATPGRLSALGAGSPNLLLFTGTGTPPQPARAAVHRLYRTWRPDHMYSLNSSEGAGQGYYLETLNYFYLLTGWQPNHNAIYRCYNGAVGDHFLSIDPGCEGRSYIGVIGYAAAWQAPGTVPLYRVYHPSYGDHFYTTDPAERQSAISSGWRDEGIQGYVYTQP